MRPVHQVEDIRKKTKSDLIYEIKEAFSYTIYLGLFHSKASVMLYLGHHTKSLRRGHFAQGCAR